jgi:membrane associated rhomboid family serine protease
MTEPAGDQRDQFGTPAFYASLGRAFVVMCAVIPVLFAIELIDKATGHALDRDGAIVPHHISGLDGIVFAPFLHVSFVHLYSNAIPLLLTGTFVLAAGGKRFLWITLLIAVTSGLGVWLFGNGPTIGASGIIFGYLGYLFLRGLIERNWWNIAVAVLVGLLFGTAITGVLPGDERVSWQAHLFGFIGGLIAAVVFRKPRPKPKPAPSVDLPSTLTIPPVSS